MDTTKERDVDSSSDSDDERASPLQVSEDKIIQLSQVGQNEILALKIIVCFIFYGNYAMIVPRAKFLPCFARFLIIAD